MYPPLGPYACARSEHAFGTSDRANGLALPLRSGQRGVGDGSPLGGSGRRGGRWFSCARQGPGCRGAWLLPRDGRPSVGCAGVKTTFDAWWLPSSSSEPPTPPWALAWETIDISENVAVRYPVWSGDAAEPLLEALSEAGARLADVPVSNIVTGIGRVADRLLDPPPIRFATGRSTCLSPPPAFRKRWLRRC